MPTTLLTLDFYNDNFYIQAGDFSHLWATRENFVNTGFPYGETVGLLTYEPLRNLYSLEYIGGEPKSGRGEEIRWIEENFDRLVENARQEAHLLENPVLSIRQTREIKLHETDWMVTRHQEELLSGSPTTLSEDQFDRLSSWRRWLRDIPLEYPDVDLDSASSSIAWAELDLTPIT